MIVLSDISVKFYEKGKEKVTAVNNVSLKVERGEIFGVIGYSGAGKSTLVRVINLLQKPTSGNVIVGDKNLMSLTTKELREERKKIGMIFQGFNLMNSRTVFGNVYYPLKRSSLSKKERDEKVHYLLSLVGLSEKEKVYPSQLSGGQKQRVAIARALANDPKVLLCDESTSALDPTTTSQILQLLKKVNEELGITMVVITHEMEVIKKVCHKVAVMEKGSIIETGDVVKIFTRPKLDLTKEFVHTANHLNNAFENILYHPSFLNMTNNDTLLQISYVGAQTTEPIISRLYSQFKVETNILFGSIEILNQTPIGNLIVILSGDSEARENAIKFLKEKGVGISFMHKDGDTVSFI